MKRPPTFWLNAGLAVALLAAGGGAWYAVQDTSVTPSAETTRTAVVRAGMLSATVTGSGNLESASSSTLDFASSGVITDIYVTAGQTVTKGQKLARINSGAAQRALASAKAGLLAAQADYAGIVKGRSATERKRDQISLSTARSALQVAKKQLAGARSSRATDLRRQNALVAAAQASLAKGTGTAAAVKAAKATRTSVLAAADDAIASARAALVSAQNEYDLQVLTLKENANSPTAADLAKGRSSVADAQAAVDDAQEALARTTLVAPHAGTVLSISSNVGDDVGAGGGSGGGAGAGSGGGTGAGSGSGSAGGSGSGAGSGGSGSSSSGSSGFISLADLRRMKVTVNVAEADIGAVKKGQSATFTLSATGTQVDGAVSDVAVIGATSNSVVTFPVTVTVDDPPKGVRVGTSAQVSITTARVQNALIVPASAVKKFGRSSTVTVLDNGVQKDVDVEVGIEGDSGVQVTKGLTAGQTVVLPSSSAGDTNGFPGPGVGSEGVPAVGPGAGLVGVNP